MFRNQDKFHKRRKFDNLIFGRQPVLELLNSEKSVDKILLQNNTDGDILSEIKKIAAQKNIPVKYVPVEKLNTLTGGIHQGIIAFTAEIEFQNIENILPLIIEQGNVPLFVLLDGITDVRNFGAIARTAYAAGAHAIILAENDAAPVNAEAMKTSAGALSKLPVCREKNFNHTLEYLKLNGLQILGADSKAEKMCFEIDFTLPVVIILGSEDIGISPSVKKYIATTIKLPMQNNFDSYNVSVAAGMLLYEIMRQRLIDNL
ncbi:MAG: 23S rRNA (guanosine(2251)-2'-O)-methyltransferase RlmB [Fimbriimonadaceae bacterium]|nr:23S rRNA (guanosine(2251)-2'-O)-methyltransferase RlmB [Chitinophagales bacterium]